MLKLLINFIINLAVQQESFFLKSYYFHWYGFFIALGILFVYFYIKRASFHYKLKFSEVEPLFFISLPLSLVGARVYHIFSQFGYYVQYPKEIFFIWQGGFGIFGLISGIIISVFLYCLIKKLDVLKVLNLFLPPLLLAQAIGRWGNYFNKEAFGPAIKYWPYFHPTFFYESFLCFLAFIFYLFLTEKYRKYDFGFAYYLISYGLIRFFTEFFRTDTWKILNIHIAHVLSLFMLIFGFYLLFSDFKKKRF